MAEFDSQQIPYPLGLLDWAGHRGGGVRKPFRPDSGRPTGRQIITPLIQRLQRWAKSLASNTESVPRTILLVGGPGNGKTDAIESCIGFLDYELLAQNRLITAFANKFTLAKGQLPPRKVTVDFSSLGVPVPSHIGTSISLVQDATEREPLQARLAEQLLLEELTERIDPDSSGIYLCCVNRGILAHAATLAQASASSANTIMLLNEITAAVTSGPESPSCWPLNKFSTFAVWPMDVDSLVDISSSSDGQTVAHQIFAVALEEVRWAAPCQEKSRCPFCENRLLLLKNGALDALIRLLRYYELASGKRWTFRDLFSLVPYLLVGDYSELKVKGKSVSPCEWTAHQRELSKTAQASDPAKSRAPYLLASRLYYHRLFPRWPNLDRGTIRSAKSILSGSSFVSGLDRARDFFRYLVYAAHKGRVISEEIASTIHGAFSQVLDPALSNGDEVLLSRGNNHITTNEIEERFSLSVNDGFKLVSDQLHPIERDLITQLAQADDSLVEENFPRTKSHHARTLQTAVRQFSARIVKRSIGTRQGLCYDVEYFKEYQEGLKDARKLLEVRKQLKKLLHDENNQFRASLGTTFGQPVAQRIRDVVLLTPAVTVKEVLMSAHANRPKEPVPYINVDCHIIPVTFSLYKALREVVSGLNESSLPAEIFALLNGIKALVSGNLVRNKQMLDDDSRIELGNSGWTIEISGDSFYIKERQWK